MIPDKSSKEFRNAKISDCGRLWSTIHDQFAPDAHIEVGFEEIAGDQWGMDVALVSGGIDRSTGATCDLIWARKAFANQLHLISAEQLFDLLIVGYRQMVLYFTNGEAHRPTQRDRPN